MDGCIFAIYGESNLWSGQIILDLTMDDPLIHYQSPVIPGISGYFGKYMKGLLNELKAYKKYLEYLGILEYPAP